MELSTALRSLFDSGRDQVVWNLSPARSIGSSGSEQIVRVDPRHEYGTAIARSIGAAKRDEPIDESSWLIIVDNAMNLLDDRVEQLQTVLGQVSRILLVACEAEAVRRHGGNVRRRHDQAAGRANQRSHAFRLCRSNRVAGRQWTALGLGQHQAARTLHAIARENDRRNTTIRRCRQRSGHPPRVQRTALPPPISYFARSPARNSRRLRETRELWSFRPATIRPCSILGRPCQIGCFRSSRMFPTH